jgi:hypothetical protein
VEDDAGTDKEVMKRGEEPRSWDRASIKVNTHPLHPRPRVRAEDLLLPSATNKFRLVADCLGVGAVMSLLAYFPLLLFALASTSDLSMWILGAMLTVGCVSALLLFAVTLVDERRFREDLASLLESPPQ